ncbi:chorismate mutase [Streptomyces sp. NPDC089919]|uniref:chorismate mutase n=1 Tax=Streptomyces sp. NPDC089919 TaxID=3155188 RepID=UPI003441FE4D
MTSTVRHMIALLVLLTVGAVALTACASSDGAGGGPSPTGTARAQSALGTLVGLAGRRMMTADTVAAAKWGTSQPIDDPAREKTVIDGATAQGAKLGIPADTVRRVFEDQIAANKTVQRALYAEWKGAPALRPTSRPDLTTQVRPVLDRIDGDLLVAIRRAEPLLGDPGCGAALDRAKTQTAADLGLDAVHREGLDRALAHLCPAPRS